MPRERVSEMLENVTGVAANAGLEYRFDLLQHTNTVKAHELLHTHYTKKSRFQGEE